VTSSVPRSPARSEVLALDALAAACAMLDIARRRYGRGRVIAWATCVLSVGVGVFSGLKPSGPTVSLDAGYATASAA